GASSTALSTLSLHDALPISLGPGNLPHRLVENLPGILDEGHVAKKYLSLQVFPGGLAGNPLVDEETVELLGPSPCGTELREDPRSEEHTSELQSRENLVCRL